MRQVHAALPERLVVMGASAGAVEALTHILPSLPSDYPFPVVCVVHVPPTERSLLAALFATRCDVRVCEAEDKMPLRGATVYFAPPDYHLLLEPPCSVSLSIDAPVQFSRPSIDVSFESAAELCGTRTIGIVLSGANSDGATGLARIVRAGGLAWVQDPATAQVTKMPEAALARLPEATVLSPTAIAGALCALAVIDA